MITLAGHLIAKSAYGYGDKKKEEQGEIRVMFENQFYPTPQDLAYKLIKKLDFSKVRCVLEPSAGKGNFVEALNSYRKEEMLTYSLQKQYEKRNEKIEFFDTKDDVFAYVKRNFNKEFCSISEVRQYFDTLAEEDFWWHFAIYEKKDSKNLLDITCVEIDPELCSILKGKHYFTINANFLDWCSFSRYDTILMNPPFADGDKHLLKAISLCENGGQICCILNAETIRNPYTSLRKLLIQKLKEYNAQIDYICNAFANAEITADVDVALIYINIPQKVINEDIAKNFVKGDVYEKEYKEFSDTQLYNGHAISLLIEQFNL